MIDCTEGNYNRKDNYAFFFAFNYELLANTWLENSAWSLTSVAWKNDSQMSDRLLC